MLVTMSQKHLVAVVVLVLLFGYLVFSAGKPEVEIQPQSLDFASLAAAAPVPGAQYFLRIKDIKGESKDAKHKDEIDILSFNFGVSNGTTPGSGGGGGEGAGRAMFDVFHFTMKVNQASPKLFLAVAQGKHIPEALLTVRRTSNKEQQEYLMWKLQDVIVSSYQTGGHVQNDPIPTESFSLSFGKIEVEYKPQKPDGTLDSPVKAGWDVNADKGT